METLKSPVGRVEWESLLDRSRIYVDLNSGGKVGDQYVVPLNGPVAAPQAANVSLQEGMLLDFWTDDGDDDGAPNPLVFSGRLHFDGETSQWVAVIAGDGFRYASQVAPETAEESLLSSKQT